LLHLIVAKCDIVSYIALVTGSVERFLELRSSLLILLFLEKHTPCGNDSFGRIRRHLRNERFGMRDLLEFILDGHLQLLDLAGVLLVLDLLGHFRSFGIEAGFEKGLRVVELVRVNGRVELGKLVVHVCRVRVVLHVEIAVS